MISVQYAPSSSLSFTWSFHLHHFYNKWSPIIIHYSDQVLSILCIPAQLDSKNTSFFKYFWGVSVLLKYTFHTSLSSSVCKTLQTKLHFLFLLFHHDIFIHFSLLKPCVCILHTYSHVPLQAFPNVMKIWVFSYERGSHCSMPSLWG